MMLPAVAIVPTLQVTVPAANVHGGVRSTNVSVDGIGAEKMTLVAGCGPLFVIVKSNWNR